MPLTLVLAPWAGIQLADGKKYWASITLVTSMASSLCELRKDPRNVGVSQEI